MANLGLGVEDRPECQGCQSREACAAGDWGAVGFEGCGFWVSQEEASEYEDYHGRK